MASNHQLVGRYKSIVTRSPLYVAKQMTPVWALTWRPGDRQGSFLGQMARRVELPVCVIQMSEVGPSRQRPGQTASARVPHAYTYLSGYTTQPNNRTGELMFGGAPANKFHKRFDLQPFPGATRKIIDSRANPSLVSLGLEMFKRRAYAARANYELPTVPTLPRCYLGFPPGALPLMEDTPALRKRVSRSLQRPLEAVNAMSPEELTPLLRAEWDVAFRPPHSEGNDSDLVLVSHQLCSDIHRSLRQFLVFDDICGMDVFNVAQLLVKPSRRLRNPATQVLGTTDLGPQESWDDKDVAVALKAMRSAMGVDEALCTDDDLCEGLLQPETRIIPSGHANPLDAFGEERTLRLMRQLCQHADCCLDSDLIAAARHPARKLYAAGMARVQLLYAPHLHPRYFQFSADDLGLARVRADFYTTDVKWRGRLRDVDSHQPRCQPAGVAQSVGADSHTVPAVPALAGIDVGSAA